MVSEPNISELKSTIDRGHDVVTRLTFGNFLMRNTYNDSIKTIQDIHADIYKLLLAESSMYFENVGDSNLNDDIQFKDQMSSVFDDVWFKIQKPLFVWFQTWKLSLPKEKRRGLKVAVERRKLLYRLKRIFKIMHRFYYTIIEKLLSRLNLSKIIPNQIIQELNIKVSNRIDPPINPLEFGETVSIVLTETIYQCIFYLGKIHYWQVLLEIREIILSIGKFSKSRRYLAMASSLLPSYGKTYSQMSLLYLKSGDAFEALYYSIRSLGTKIRHKHSMIMFKNIIQGNSIRNVIIDSDDIRKMRVEDAFLMVLKYYYNHNYSNTKLINTISKMFFTDFKFSGGPRGTDIIFKMIIVIAGCLHERMPKDETKMKSFHKVILTKNQQKYLDWTFDLVSGIFNVIIINNYKEKFNNETGSLGILRFIMCWIKSNKYLLQYAHRNRGICKILANSVNMFNDHHIVGTNLYVEHRPERPYLFQEDILVRELFYIKYRLTDFNDKIIFEHKDIVNGLLGCPEDSLKLSVYSENLLRLTAIISSIIKFLSNNKFGIVWNREYKIFNFDLTSFEQYEKRRETITLDKSIDLYQKEIRQQLDPTTKIFSLTTLIGELSPRKKKRGEGQQVNEAVLEKRRLTDISSSPEKESTDDKCSQSGICFIQDRLLSSEGKEGDWRNPIPFTDDSHFSSLIDDDEIPSLKYSDYDINAKASSILDIVDLMNDL
ncbi:similar to Saccharomyces cerevisiae YDR206W EBS1 Protein involved in inhibition of translation and nonsense-mediated decay [Maudiozyma barnettii]|uniref:Similar to Saccharomyces cerevisiae YDR206W EBS1 Protein involved in inhibition of translation and nonsense-mediated decay n=1 Tax=Maudiozyma barnettii TaxID=61262 RepID=A0A8H2VGR6_9SACH|nr:uncharacterized protein KABA2_05S10230 [Kazachstania barnettii]CAB4255180.1 similar to Saccharomyces cerevisiae YDR206W EBS1 Protein involved in inhibition of translation and nonsense-mediated decay [Kazachstania barnettii]CAD1783451.1 similar to Saccharomyces cerevisiae YDR206W EBS1 Protein involved in inhibition of translation and nonsense-mediated decay [Kazachstania barnettii]